MPWRLRMVGLIEDSLRWVHGHSSENLGTVYFDYGHGSIADPATSLSVSNRFQEPPFGLEDEQVWDGQAKSSRYQNFCLLQLVCAGHHSRTGD